MLKAEVANKPQPFWSMGQIFCIHTNLKNHRIKYSRQGRRCEMKERERKKERKERKKGKERKGRKE